MNSLWRALGLVVVVHSLVACGAVNPSSLLDAQQQPQTPKTACPGAHAGFFVCMADQSEVKDKTVEASVQLALGELASLVNTPKFQNQIKISFEVGTGDVIDQSLVTANYIVTITGFCDPSSDVLANAIVGGDTINFNECRVQKDSKGQIDVPQVAGVLLHEISHNLGYQHPAVNPSRSTVPYFLGDLAEADLAPAHATTTTITRGTWITGD